MLEFLFKAVVVFVWVILAGGFSVFLYGVCLGLKGRGKNKEAKPEFPFVPFDKTKAVYDPPRPEAGEDVVELPAEVFPSGVHPADPYLENQNMKYPNCKCQPIQQRGKLHFTLHGIQNPVIVETFFRKFDEAVVATSHCEEFYNGTVSLVFEVKGCALSDNLRRDFEKAGFCINDNK